MFSVPGRESRTGSYIEYPRERPVRLRMAQPRLPSVGYRERERIPMKRGQGNHALFQTKSEKERKRKKPRTFVLGFRRSNASQSWRLPIFPGRFQPSIVGASELNCRVRDGNGWTLTAIDTNYLRICLSQTLRTEQREKSAFPDDSHIPVIDLLQVKPSVY